MKKQYLCIIAAIMLVIVSIFSWRGTEEAHTSATEKSDSGLLCAIYEADIDMESLPANRSEMTGACQGSSLLRLIPVFIAVLLVVLFAASIVTYTGLVFCPAYLCPAYHIFFMHAKDGEK